MVSFPVVREHVMLDPLRLQALQPFFARSLAFQADSFLEEAGNRPRVGQAFLVIDPDALAGRRDYLERVEALVAEMLKDREVRLPGHRREALEARADVEGIDVSDALYAELMQLAA